MVIMLLGFYIQAPAADSELTPVSLQLKWSHQFQFAGYYAAKELGYYKEEGLDVELHEFFHTDTVVNKVVSGKVDFGIGDSTILAEFVNGQPIVALSAIAQENPLVLFAKKSSGISKPSDLIGKKVMFDSASVGGASIQAMLSKQNISPSKYTYFIHNYNYQGLIDGTIDAVSGYLTSTTYFYQNHNTPINIIKPQSYGVNFYGDILFTSQKLLKQDPETVEKFRRASLKGWSYAVSHSDEIINLILSKYNKTLTEDELNFEAQEMIKLMDYPVIEIGHMHQQRWAHIADIFLEQGMIKQEVDFERFIYQPTEKSYLYLISSLIFLITFLLLWVFRNYINHKRLTKKLTQLYLAFGTTRQGWFDINVKTGVISASNEYAQMLGYKPAEFKPSIKSWLQSIHDEDRERVSNALTTSEVTEVEYRCQNRSGSWLWIHSVGQVSEWDKEGSPSRVIGVQTDITERKLADESRKLSARVFSDTHEGITVTDAGMNIIDVNPAFCEITGYSRDEVIGKNPRFLSSGKQSPEFYQDMWQQINEQGHWQGEVWNRKKSGEIFAELLTISVLKDELDKAVNYVGVFTDITSSKKQQEQLSLMAHYDVLTGLPNRALFADRFRQAIAHSKRTNHQLAVCFLDLDNFKPVNDNYGHEVGDQLLIEVAKRITANIREEDTISRQGGDEFALLLNDIESFAQCEQTLQRIHHALAQPFLIDGYTHKVTASSGVTLYPHDDGDIDTLLRHADQAMYQAKLEGKNRHHLFNREHDQRTIQKHHQLDEIEQALVNNEFQLYYQPKVNMRTGDVYGAEALIRWIHPEKGLIPPLDFLPLIDNTDLELQVGDWVINQALQQMDSWLTQGIKLEVSVNIASHHLQSGSFFINLETALARYPAIDSQYFQLEILESSVLSDLQAISSIIKTCREVLGVNIALDDFGTGYSSLTHLRNLTANTIKIDQSFVRDMLDDPDDYTIIDGVIGLADSFSRDIIAEGVETTEHGLMLLMMGCEKVQGYGISRPMPATDFPEWLATYTPNQEWLSDGKKVRTDKETQIKLYRLTSEHWKNTMVSKVQSSQEDKQCWPIMTKKLCHSGRWIKRAKKEGLFGQDSLARLESVHDNVHFIAQEIQCSYEAGELDKARGALEGLVTAYNEMSNAIGMCE